MSIVLGGTRGREPITGITEIMPVEDLNRAKLNEIDQVTMPDVPEGRSLLAVETGLRNRTTLCTQDQDVREMMSRSRDREHDRLHWYTGVLSAEMQSRISRPKLEVTKPQKGIVTYPQYGLFEDNSPAAVREANEKHFRSSDSVFSLRDMALRPAKDFGVEFVSKTDPSDRSAVPENSYIAVKLPLYGIF